MGLSRANTRSPSPCRPLFAGARAAYFPPTHAPGTIELADFYKYIEEKRSIICDAIFELNDCNTSGTLDFGEFFCSVVTYCLFEREEILRYCFYIFDREKNGYIEQDELMMMINILYGIAPTDQLRGNAKVAANQLEFNTDGKVDFKEFKEFNKQFPALFYPAFRIQVGGSG